MQIETVFVGAPLVVEEKLAKLRGAERGPDHSVVEHKLVDREDCDGALSRGVEGEVGRVRWSAPRRIVDVFGIDYHFLQVPVLPEVLH